MIADLAERRSTADGFFACFATKEDLNVHHIVLDDDLRVVLFAAVEN